MYVLRAIHLAICNQCSNSIPRLHMYPLLCPIIQNYQWDEMGNYLAISPWLFLLVIFVSSMVRCAKDFESLTLVVRRLNNWNRFINSDSYCSSQLPVNAFLSHICRTPINYAKKSVRACWRWAWRRYQTAQIAGKTRSASWRARLLTCKSRSRGATNRLGDDLPHSLP